MDAFSGMRAGRLSTVLLLWTLMIEGALGQSRPPNWQDYLYPVYNFQTTQPYSPTYNDRFLSRTGFWDVKNNRALPGTIQTDHVAVFGYGTASWRKWDSKKQNVIASGTIGWEQQVLPIPRSSTHQDIVWELDRSRGGKPYSDEPNPDPDFGTLKELWGNAAEAGNMSRVLDSAPLQYNYDAWL